MCIFKMQTIVKEGKLNEKCDKKQNCKVDHETTMISL